ncbi:type 4 fimbrial biogenesis protein PilP [gamma proteobacterium HTCC2207]|jgi:type IV pilus assembly protein PilP|uniref:Type 4 fimbrial biogenesis protein PilP n=1 Tax=gamma proteobacterium HTCC2207 TaxID=314287 RepID=Q1YS05_9GAMM|nr:type 4 fimbrial biogenesis protein PilP [gamma proteobacterium HTCC2207]MBT6114294.1 pilus assembly protein PilP [Porticoccaceae bacterium]
MSKCFIAIALVFVVSLAGCSSDRQHSDLDKKMSDARTRPQGVIEPLPEYPEPDRFNYSALALRSPFEAPAIFTGDEKVSGKSVSAPDQSRIKEPLELISYTSLSMAGILARGNQMWALVDDGDGKVHRVKAGNYIGRNFGLITLINRREIEVMETVPDGKGGWINRPRTLAMEE